MNTLQDESGERLAHCLRREREARGWSLAQLAQRSDVSKAAISKIERGETSPTAALLVRLAGAFDLTLAGLLLRAESADRDPPGRLSRAADQASWRDPDSGYLRRQVFMHPEHPLEIVEVDMPPGRRVALPAASYARIRQAIRVVAGELQVDEGGERHRLGAGDCLGFGPPSDVTIANPGTVPCTYLVVLARS